jgi:hypothetical protein
MTWWNPATTIQAGENFNLGIDSLGSLMGEEEIVQCGWLWNKINFCAKLFHNLKTKPKTLISAKLSPNPKENPNQKDGWFDIESYTNKTQNIRMI